MNLCEPTTTNAAPVKVIVYMKVLPPVTVGGRFVFLECRRLA